MAENKNGKIIMGWSKCKVDIGKTGDNDAFAADLFNVGKTRNQTTTLSSNDGDTLTETASGGEVVAMEQLDGTYQLQTTVIEPSAELYKVLGIAEDEDSNGEQKIKTHVVDGDFSIKVTPKNKGAKGIKAPVCRISVAPAYDEQDGNSLVITANIIKTTGVAPAYVKKSADGWTATTTTEDIAAAKNANSPIDERDLPEDAATGDVYAIDKNYWYSRFTTKKALR